MRPVDRKRADDDEPVGRPDSASRVISAMTTRSYRKKPRGDPTMLVRPERRSLRLVLAAEDLRHRTILEDGVDGVADDAGDRADLDLVDGLLGRNRQGVGDDDP